MSYKTGPEHRAELVDVAEILAGTLDNTTADGILIEKIVESCGANGVRYTDTNNPAKPKVEMSAAAYAAEFYKAAGGDLNTADFDRVMNECRYIGDILGNALLVKLGFQTVREMVSVAGAPSLGGGTNDG